MNEIGVDHSLAAHDSEFRETVRRLRIVGYGHMMQIVSDEWCGYLMARYGTEAGAFEPTPIGAYAAALARNTQLEEALREYADEKNWSCVPGGERTRVWWGSGDGPDTAKKAPGVEG